VSVSMEGEQGARAGGAASRPAAEEAPHPVVLGRLSREVLEQLWMTYLRGEQLPHPRSLLGSEATGIPVAQAKADSNVVALNGAAFPASKGVEAKAESEAAQRAQLKSADVPAVQGAHGNLPVPCVAHSIPPATSATNIPSSSTPIVAAKLPDTSSTSASSTSAGSSAVPSKILYARVPSERPSTSVKPPGDLVGKATAQSASGAGTQPDQIKPPGQLVGKATIQSASACSQLALEWATLDSDVGSQISDAADDDDSDDLQDLDMDVPVHMYSHPPDDVSLNLMGVISKCIATNQLGWETVLIGREIGNAWCEWMQDAHPWNPIFRKFIWLAKQEEIHRGSS
jgi:hypothetical protein